MNWNRLKKYKKICMISVLNTLPILFDIFYLEVTDIQEAQIKDEMNKNSFNIIGDNLPCNTNEEHRNYKSYLNK